MTANFLSFPSDFVWGTATASYQIEGAANKDGRGKTVWDTFSHTPGKIYQGHTGDVAADHYHRYKEDVGLMSTMGLNAYRFSTAWSRVLPEGTGAVNQKGLDFYNRLVDELLAHNITPYITLFHWDLPQTLHDAGGWANRETAYHFAEYARIMVDALGDRVTNWITHNEPWVVAVIGHYTGRHAPGVTDLGVMSKSAYYLALSHGLAVEAMRAAASRPLTIGITLDYSPIHALTDSEEDQAAILHYDVFRNRLMFDPLLSGTFSQHIVETLGEHLPEITTDDLQQMNVPIEFVGLNYYTRTVVKGGPVLPLMSDAVLPDGSEYSMMWEIYPQGMYESLTRIYNEWQPKALYVTENGVCVPDEIDFDNRIRDYRRIRYLRDHFAQAHRAMQDGIPLKGYFVWSMLDNFEWAYGYRMRFGLVHIDFETLERRVKQSGHWYAQVIRDNGLDPSPGGSFLPG